MPLTPEEKLEAIKEAIEKSPLRGVKLILDKVILKIEVTNKKRFPFLRDALLAENLQVEEKDNVLFVKLSNKVIEPELLSKNLVIKYWKLRFEESGIKSSYFYKEKDRSEHQSPSAIRLSGVSNEDIEIANLLLGAHVDYTCKSGEIFIKEKTLLSSSKKLNCFFQLYNCDLVRVKGEKWQELLEKALSEEKIKIELKIENSIEGSVLKISADGIFGSEVAKALQIVFANLGVSSAYKGGELTFKLSELKEIKILSKEKLKEFYRAAKAIAVKEREDEIRRDAEQEKREKEEMLKAIMEPATFGESLVKSGDGNPRKNHDSKIEKLSKISCRIEFLEKGSAANPGKQLRFYFRNNEKLNKEKFKGLLFGKKYSEHTNDKGNFILVKAENFKELDDVLEKVEEYIKEFDKEQLRGIAQKLPGLAIYHGGGTTFAPDPHIKISIKTIAQETAVEKFLTDKGVHVEKTYNAAVRENVFIIPVTSLFKLTDLVIEEFCKKFLNSSDSSPKFMSNSSPK